jgi:hypothetical protein
LGNHVVILWISCLVNIIWTFYCYFIYIPLTERSTRLPAAIVNRGFRYLFVLRLQTICSTWWLRLGGRTHAGCAFLIVFFLLLLHPRCGPHRDEILHLISHIMSIGRPRELFRFVLFDWWTDVFTSALVHIFSIIITLYLTFYIVGLNRPYIIIYYFFSVYFCLQGV